jgi:hypothetical protein
MVLRQCLLVACLVVVGCEARADVWAGDEIKRSPRDDWARVWTTEAAKRLTEKRGEFDCARLGSYVSANDPWAAYFAIRDEGLFGGARCKDLIAEHEAVLRKHPVVVVAVDFYQARGGDQQALGSLLRVFDQYAARSERRPSTDHVSVSLFGFFPDWARTGRRLFRYLNHADGAAATLARDALEWKHQLYGHRPGYAQECLSAARAEIDEGRLKLSALCPK